MNPAEMLEGITLEGEWKVIEKIVKKPNATGGFFSTGYRVVEPSGREGFLKAMDYSNAFDNPDPQVVPLLLNQMSEAFLFEKSLCELCRDKTLRRVVHAIASGTVKVNPSVSHSVVSYIIFELAGGDVRAHLDAQVKLDLAFTLRTLHNVAAALRELHLTHIAHQDLKPSNVLVFPRENRSKIGDLGRAWSGALRSPYEDLPIAGDKTYAPPEFLYREVPADVNGRRYGCDLYQLGSLTVFFFTRTHINALVLKYLALEHRYNAWGGSYTDVLPYVLEAFARAIGEFSVQVPELVRSHVVELVKQLCDPDPVKRGHPLTRHSKSSHHALERYISLLNLLEHRATTSIKHGG